MVGEQLQWNGFKDRKQVFVGWRHRNEVIGAFDQVGIAFIAERDNDAVA